MFAMAYNYKFYQNIYSSYQFQHEIINNEFIQFQKKVKAYLFCFFFFVFSQSETKN